MVHEYVDRASAKTADRPQFKRMFEDASKRKFDLVLFWSLDRFSREGVLETLKHLERLSAWGVDWRSYQEAYFDCVAPSRTWLCRLWRRWPSKSVSASASGRRLACSVPGELARPWADHESK
jgi:hypothetical protein